MTQFEDSQAGSRIVRRLATLFEMRTSMLARVSAPAARRRRTEQQITCRVSSLIDFAVSETGACHLRLTFRR